MNKAGRGSLQINLGRRAGGLVSAAPFSATLVLGPHRSRKTSGVAVPALLEWPGPALISSIREDVIEQTIAMRQTMGEVMIIDPAEVLEDWPDRAGWSPIDFVDNWDDSQTAARLLVESHPPRGVLNENHWTEAAIRLLSPFLLAAAKDGGTMADVTRWIRTRDEAAVTERLTYLGEDGAAEAMESQKSILDREKSTIYSSLEVALGVWGRQVTQNLSAAEPRFRFPKFFNGDANTVYLCAPPDAQREYRPYFNAFMRLFLREVYKANRGFASSTLGMRGPIAALEASRGHVNPLLVVLDDTGAVAPIPDLDNFVATAAKVAIQLVTAFTDLSQIQAIYGEAAARTIVNNHSYILIMPGCHDASTATLVDDLLKGETLPEGPATNETIRHLPWGKALCIGDNTSLGVIDLRSSLTDSDLVKLRGLDDGGY